MDVSTQSTDARAGRPEGPEVVGMMDMPLDEMTAVKQDPRPPPRKRRRIVISCTECHRRKQKCDRKLPCTNCVSRSKQSACRYETGAPAAKRHGKNGTTARAVATSTSSPEDRDQRRPRSSHGHGHDHDHVSPNSAAAASDTTPISPPDRVADFGYTDTGVGVNTLGFLHRLEAQPDEGTDFNMFDGGHDDPDDSTTTTTSSSRKNTRTSSTTTITTTTPSSAHPSSTTTATTSTSPTTLPPAFTSLSAAVAPPTDPFPTLLRNSGGRYLTLARRLPPRRAIERLAGVWFDDLNWQYDALDRAVFERQLGAWFGIVEGESSPSGLGSGSGSLQSPPMSQQSQVPPQSTASSARGQGPGPPPGLTLSVCGRGGGGGVAELRAFPALVFQICAVALLVLDEEAESELRGLLLGGKKEEEVEVKEEGLGGAGAGAGGGRRRGSRATFEDLASEYSEAGMEVLGLLGKRGMGLNTVLAGWMRANFLKFVGLVTESWHAVGAAIRDAQEIGLHRSSQDPKPASDALEAVLETQWEIQHRRKMWIILSMWDIHMALTFGRPTTIDLNFSHPPLPVDALPPKDRSRTPVLPRDENDPPTPLTRTLWAYELMQPMKLLLDLEKGGPFPKDFERVDRLHRELLELDARTPACFRLENPDTRFDALPECWWLPTGRAILAQITLFSLEALHRPYIFTRATSRTEALKANLATLQAQSIHFLTLSPRMYSTFCLFFGTFDAIVMMSSIYILFPKEHPEMVHSAIQHFQWAVERFETMAPHNPLVKAALSVLYALYLRLKKALRISCRTAQKMLGSSSAACQALARSLSTAERQSRPAQQRQQKQKQGPQQQQQQQQQQQPPPQQQPALQTPPSNSNTPPSATSVPPPPPPPSSSLPPPPDLNFSFTPGIFGSGSISTATDTDTIDQQDTMDRTSGSTDSGVEVGPGGGGVDTFDWTLPSNFDWASVQPIYPTSDLLFHDLVGASAAGVPFVPVHAGHEAQGVPGMDGGGGDGSASTWAYHEHGNGNGGGNGYGHGHVQGSRLQGYAAGHGGAGAVDAGNGGGGGGGGMDLHGMDLATNFGGDFGDDSVWSVLNQYAPF